MSFDDIPAPTWANRLRSMFGRQNGNGATLKLKQQQRAANGTPRGPATSQQPKQQQRVDSWVEAAEMIEQDPAFALGIRTIRALISATEVSITGATEDPRAQALAEHLTATWYDSLTHAMRAIGYGYQGFEKWYDHDTQASLEKVAVKPLPALQIKPHISDGGDEVRGIDLQNRKRQDADADIPADSSWWLAIDEYAHPSGWIPQGNSIYSWGAWKVFEQRKRLADQREIFVDNCANGKIIGFAPDVPRDAGGQPSPQKKGDTGEVDDQAEPIDPMYDMGAGYGLTKSGGIMVVQSGNYSAELGGGPLYSVQSIPITPNTAPIDGEETRSREDALAIIGIPPRAVMQDMAAGSFSSVQAFLKVLFYSVQYYLDQLVKSFQENIVEPSEARNFPAGQRPGLKLEYQRIDYELQGLIVEIVKQVILSGNVSAIITEGVIDFEKLLDYANIPTGDNLPARLAKLKETQAAQQAAAAGPQFSLARQLSNTPASLAKTPDDHAARMEREMVPTFRELLELIVDGPEFDEDGKMRGLSAETRRRL